MIRNNSASQAAVIAHSRSGFVHPMAGELWEQSSLSSFLQSSTFLSLIYHISACSTWKHFGFTTLCANDHLTFSRPWLDSVTALASILTKTRHITLMTTVALPVVRGPIPLAKSLAALDVLSGGRLIAGVDPGSLPQDHALVGIAFEERWTHFDECQ